MTAPSWQTNGTVRAIDGANGVVFLGGEFTSVRPPGAAAGTGEVARSRFAALNSETGALITTFNPAFNNVVRAIEVSPDGSIVYVGGDFTTVNGVTRNRIAAFSTSTGQLLSWAPSVNNRVSGIAATGSTVYIAGTFSTVAGVSRARIAALRSDNAQVIAAFNASADNIVYDIALSQDGTKLYLAGGFLSVNGDTNQQAGAVVSAATGALLPFGAASVIPRRSPGCIVETHVRGYRCDLGVLLRRGHGAAAAWTARSQPTSADGGLKWLSRCLGRPRRDCCQRVSLRGVTCSRLRGERQF